MNLAPDNVNISVGKAVLAAQYFEQWLVCAYYHMRIVSEDDFSLSEEQLSDYRLFKNPTKNLVKALAERSKIDPALESRINCLLELRHTVMHRWFLYNGTPTKHTPEHWVRLTETADSVTSEALELSLLLLHYMGEGLRLQLAGDDLLPAKEHMTRIFQALEKCTIP